ncbi:heptaprenylglyceryl phosphate synthase [Marinicrinis lubricantis]|uniref:Heptaprenylglyceryl phosphate synthase n=1 Tax=Marinicrinis lubricantis TaxID=2086470 RepID=A0ABW1IP13_9BACL
MIRNEMNQWKHLFKLDPEKPISDEALEAICMSGTDAVMIGGSTGITFENTVDLLSRVRRYTVPCVQEISDMESIVPGFDLYFIPVVMNSTDSKWITGLHQQAVKQYGHRIPWDQIVTEGYCILNPDCTAARITDSHTALDEKDVAAYAKLGEQMFHLPVIYLEYSGMFGDMDKVRSAAWSLESARLFYGGGISNLEQAQQALEYADTIVVGNVIYTNLPSALETVRAVQRV